jgi:hypothetical protein
VLKIPVSQIAVSHARERFRLLAYQHGPYDGLLEPNPHGWNILSATL